MGLLSFEISPRSPVKRALLGGPLILEMGSFQGCPGLVGRLDNQLLVAYKRDVVISGRNLRDFVHGFISSRYKTPNPFS